MYSRMNAEISKARKRGDIQTAHRLEVERRGIPSVDPYDENYRRCRYVRYADDFLIGFTGSKADAEKIKAEMHDFLKQELHLELSEEKTLITSASSQAAKFRRSGATITSTPKGAEALMALLHCLFQQG